MGNSVSRDEVIAARRKYESLRNRYEETRPEVYPNFPTGGDPKLKVFNVMSRIIEDRTEMIAAAERRGEQREARKGSNHG